jgi:hypothetical protein
MFIPSRADFTSLCATLIGFLLVPRMALAQESLPGPGEKEAAIETALNEPTSFDFTDKPLEDVEAFLEQKHRVQIQLDTRALALVRLEHETTITRQMHDVKLRSALDLLLRDFGLTYVVRDEVLLITTASEAKNLLTTKVYPVANLLAPHDDGVLVTLRENFGELIEMITSTIEPDSWDDTGGPGTIKQHSLSTSLVVTQTYAVHREIAALLASLRAVGQVQPVDNEIETPPAAIDDGQLQLKVYQLPSIGFVAGLSPAVPAHPTTAAPETSAPATPAAPAGTPTVPGTASAPMTMEMAFALQQELVLRPQRELLKMIESVTGPNTWTGNGGQGGVSIVNRSLVVRQTGSVHRQIVLLLEAISAAGKQQPFVGGGMGGMNGF